jgi:hypothetical protein
MKPSDLKPMKPDSPFFPISKLPATGSFPVNLRGPLERTHSGLPARGVLVGMFGLGLACTATAGLTRRWALNEHTLAGGILESVSGSTAGQLFGDSSGVILKPGANAADRSFLFNGTNNAVSTELSNLLPTTGSFSVFVTAKFATNYQGGARLLFSNNNAQAGRIDFGVNGTAGTPNQLTFFYGGTANLSLSFTDSVASPILFDGGWHEVGIVRSGSSYQLYVDGVARGSAGTSSLAISTNTVYRIGRRNAFSGFYNNAISEVQVFDEVRTAGLPILAYDSDSDNIADSWEVRYFTNPGEDPVADLAAILARCTPAGDLDSDGLDNLTEFTGGSLPGNIDTDADGLEDGEETGTGTWVSSTQTGTNRLKADTDGDGLLDDQENNSGTYVSPTDTGTNPNLADTDGDTFNDYLEIARSTSPVSNASTPGTSSATPLVDLDALSLPAGTLSSWNNAGTLGRSFEANQAPIVGSIGGVKGVTFFGNEVMTGPVAPSNLTGGSPRTVQAWIFNPDTSTEETIVSWGRRDGPNGTMSSFLHGTSTAFGAVGNWGTPDMTWGPDAPAIASNVKLGSWTYVVYTYDGAPGNVGTVYSNGNLANTEALGLLNTWAVDNTAAARPLPIRVAGQNAANGTLSAAGQKGSLTIARLRIHDRVVPAADLGFNDSDSDGMKDWYEDFYGLNKTVDDSALDADSDGLANLAEQAAGTNPSLADSDEDGMADGWEVANFGNQTAEPLADADNDGSVNLDEYLATQGLLIVRDVDGNVTGRTPFTGSSNPKDANSQPDSDSDTLPDGWEYFFLSGLTDSASTDSDGDTFTNDAEFIAGSDPGDPNSTPSDIDADGLADAWEKTHFVTIAAQDGNGDPDGDGAINEAEESGASDPNNPASQPDADADNLPDGYELIHFGTIDRDGSGDFDGDTHSDLAEYTATSNPIRVGNTPLNVHDTVAVAVATSAGLDEWSVTDNVWTKTRTISPGLLDTVLFHNNSFYGVAGADVVKIDPASGARTILATRNSGDALAAGWTDAGARDMELGPDGKLYFTTAFGAAAGQGVFRLNLDGTGFGRFIARTGGVSPDNWELNNAIGLAWVGGDLYVSARGAFGSTNRPIYKFDSAGILASTFTGTLTGPMGLCLDGAELVVGGSNNPSALISLKLADASPSYVKTGFFSVDVINILGELHAITFSSGNGGNGSILKAGPKAAMSVMVGDLTSTGNDLATFTVTSTPYETWATGFGIDPDGPQGGETGDFDGDGTLNGVEFALGLNPTSGTSSFAITRTGAPATGITLTWPSAEGISFQVRSSTDLSDWSTLEATILGAAGEPTASWTAPAATGGKRFYRIEFTP